MKVLKALLVGVILATSFTFLPAMAATPAAKTPQVTASQDEVAYRVYQRPYRGYYGHPVYQTRTVYYNNYPYVTYYNNYPYRGYGYYDTGYYPYPYPYQSGGFSFRISI